jgi:hypothetical protein
MKHEEEEEETMVNLDEDIEGGDLFADDHTDELLSPRNAQQQHQVKYEDYFYFTTVGWIRIISITLFIIIVSLITFLFSDQVFSGLDVKFKKKIKKRKF